MFIRRNLSLAVLAFVMAMTAVAGAHAATPPINCHAARNPVERTICASPEIVALDQEITALYNRGMAKFAGEARHRLAQSQLAYLRRRAGCSWASHHSAHPGPAVDECIRSSMGDRLRGLRNAIDKAGF
jgi:uncharacterized protein